MLYLKFFNTAADNPHRKSDVFGPYDEVVAEPAMITVKNVGMPDFVIAMRDSEAQWYCDADGDLYTDVQILNAKPQA